MRRLLAVALGGVVLAMATPAWAHQEISPGSVPTGRPAFLFLSAANEKQVDLTRVSIDPPPGGQFGHATRDPAGWTASLTHTNVTWTGGAVRPSRFEQFGFDVEPFAQPGTVSYRVTFGYADGTSQQVEVPVSIRQSADAPADGSPSAGATVPTTAARAPEPTTETTPALAGSAEGDGDGAEDLATVALVLSVVALLASAATALASHRRSDREPVPASAGGGQDW